MNDELKEAAYAAFLGGRYNWDNFTFTSFKVLEGSKDAYRACLNFTPYTRGIYLYGPCRIGKTHLAVAAARRCIEQGLCTAPKLVTPYEISREAREGNFSFLDNLVNKKVLIIDDIGATKMTEYGYDTLFEIINNRIGNNRGMGTIITSNCDLDYLASKFGDDRLVSRIAETCDRYLVKGE